MTRTNDRPDWLWYGGRSSVDFVNTRMKGRDSGAWEELLPRPDDLAAWLAAAGFVLPAAAVDDNLLAQAKELRTAIDAGVRAVAAENGFPARTQRTINGWLTDTAEHQPRLELEDGTPALRTRTAPSDVHGALCHIAFDAAELLGTDSRKTVRICANRNCSGRFVDLSAGQRRRWCRMAVCGNRAKAAQHRRSTTPPAEPGH